MTRLVINTVTDSALCYLLEIEALTTREEQNWKSIKNVRPKEVSPEDWQKFREKREHEWKQIDRDEGRLS